MWPGHVYNRISSSMFFKFPRQVKCVPFSISNSSRNVRKAFQASCDQAAISEQPRMPGLTRHESFSDAGWCWAIWAIWARRLLRPIALAQPRHRHDSMLLGVTAPRVHLGDSLDWRQVLWGSFLSQTRLTSQVHFHKCTYIQLTRY